MLLMSQERNDIAVQICYAEAIYDADFNSGRLNLHQVTKSVEIDDLIILKTMKTGHCQYLSKTMT